jgi:hypothetical protein
MAAFEFQCGTCGAIHRGIPAFGWSYPIQYLVVPELERAARCSVGSDECVIDGEFFFVRGCLEIPVVGTGDVLSWGAWVSLSEANFKTFLGCYDEPARSHVGPFFGWLSSSIPSYPDTVNLKTLVHLRDNGIRPFIELEPTDHPLAIEQRVGISWERIAELYEIIVHGAKPTGDGAA